MIVTTRDKLTYEVLSETVHQQYYLVDLSEHKGNGECSCTDFSTRRLPILNKTGKIVQYGKPDATRCKHKPSGSLARPLRLSSTGLTNA